MFEWDISLSPHSSYYHKALKGIFWLQETGKYKRLIKDIIGFVVRYASSVKRALSQNSTCALEYHSQVIFCCADFPTFLFLQ